jgi:antitoxin MazE
MFKIKISSWGNRLGFRIPESIVKSFDIKPGDELELTSVEEGLLIKKSSRKSYRLGDIMDFFLTSDDVPEIDFGEAKGEEIW